jgi:kynurenine formamidase
MTIKRSVLDLQRRLLKHGIPPVADINNTGLLGPGHVRSIPAPLLAGAMDGAPCRVMAEAEG